jgi:hypothetical protein
VHSLNSSRPTEYQGGSGGSSLPEPAE